MLSEEMVEKFRELYRKRYGKEISKAEAYEQGTALLRMMRVIYRPIPQRSKVTNN